MPSATFDLLRDVQRVLRLYEIAAGARYGVREIRTRVIETMQATAAEATKT